MKYIDAEKLIAWLKKTMESYKSQMVDPTKYPIDYIDLMAFLGREYQAIIANVESLQQDKETLELCSKIWWEEQGWIMIPPNVTIKGIESLLKQVRKKLQQEQPEVDLDNLTIMEEIRKCGCNPNEFDIARHFYELGRTRKEE